MRRGAIREVKRHGADLNPLCRAEGIDVNGDRETSVAILFGGGTIVAERQAWLIRELRAEATPRALDAEVETWNVGSVKNANTWTPATMRKCRGQREEVD